MGCHEEITGDFKGEEMSGDPSVMPANPPEARTKLASDDAKGGDISDEHTAITVGVPDTVGCSGGCDSHRDVWSSKLAVPPFGT